MVMLMEWALQGGAWVPAAEQSVVGSTRCWEGATSDGASWTGGFAPPMSAFLNSSRSHLSHFPFGTVVRSSLLLKNAAWPIPAERETSRSVARGRLPPAPGGPLKVPSEVA